MKEDYKFGEKILYQYTHTIRGYSATTEIVKEGVFIMHHKVFGERTCVVHLKGNKTASIVPLDSIRLKKEKK